MDPIGWTTIAEFWWIAPAVIGAGAFGWFGLRHQRTERARRLAFDAAKQELRAARQRSATARATARVARAELARAQAERTASLATSSDVAAARADVQSAQRETRAAAATLRAARARVTAARAALPRPATPADEFPLARLTAQHDAVTARWMEYETDAARVLAFPAMTDARHPRTAAFLTAQAEAQRLRPTAARRTRAQVTATEFTAYRDAVQRLERAFDAAEQEAWRLARAAGTAPAGGSVPRGPASESTGVPPWSAIAQSAVSRSAEALNRAAEAAASALEGRLGGESRRPSPSPNPSPGPTPQPNPEQPKTPKRNGPDEGIWPVPSRGDRRPGPDAR
ncbi:hypothetical protein LJR045_000104 [Microbacterium sp. LjRoot45]|uniref:hypothetical protein n=1 Tax=Microbacterium sp. LjRoot45 TaxID=3342329 RepID=UPI003ECFFEB3